MINVVANGESAEILNKGKYKGGKYKQGKVLCA